MKTTSIRTKILCFFLAVSSLAWTQKNEVYDLSTDQKINPLGLGNHPPQLAWKIKSDDYDVSQTKYQLLVGTQANFKAQDAFWNSGVINSNQSVHVPYAGPALKTNTTYYWKVRVWTNTLKKPMQSAEAYWSTGLNPNDWKAQWIGQTLEDDLSRRSPYFKTEFRIENKTVQKAYLHITSKGMYEAHLNGKRVGDGYLTPGWTSYNARLQYQTYDVTSHLAQENALGVVLGNGWYRGYLAWDDNKNIYGDRLGLKAQLMIQYQDGSMQILGTNENWTYNTGPIIDSELYDGEIFDAQQHDPNWAIYGHPLRGARKAQLQEEDNVPLIATNNELIKKHEVFEVKEKIITPSGDLVLDFGQNLVGWVAFQHGGKAGDSLHIYHAEILDKDGEFYTKNLRSANQKNSFILNGDPNLLYEPHFTFQGFRYIKIEGDKTIDPSKFKAIALYSAMPKSGAFETSNALINQLQHNIEWGQKGNFLDVPTDCPQRDERLGWTGDAQAFFNTAAFNRNVKNFFDKWLLDLAEDQRKDGSIPFVVPNVLGENAMGSAGWADAATIIPWNAYLNYGDLRALKQHYPSMKKWVQYMESLAKDGLYKGGFHFGDWLFYRPNDDNDGRAAVTSKELIAQSFFIHSIEILKLAAKAINNKSDFDHYAALHKIAKEAFVKEFVTPTGRLISETQTAYVLALQFDLFPDHLKSQAVDRLVANIKSYDNHLTTGFLGTPYLCHVLSQNDRSDMAIKLLLQKSYPSWLYPVTQGATTIWERWDGLKPDGSTQTPSMNSYNHYAYGAIGEWMYTYLLGIQKQTAHPGFKQFTIKPIFPEEFTSVKGHYDSAYGTIAVAWQQDQNSIELSVEVPANSQAKIDLSNVEAMNRQLYTKKERKARSMESFENLGSGTYRIVINKKK